MASRRPGKDVVQPGCIEFWGAEVGRSPLFILPMFQKQRHHWCTFEVPRRIRRNVASAHTTSKVTSSLMRTRSIHGGGRQAPLKLPQVHGASRRQVCDLPSPHPFYARPYSPPPAPSAAQDRPAASLQAGSQLWSHKPKKPPGDRSACEPPWLAGWPGRLAGGSIT